MTKAIVKTMSLAPETTFEDIFHYVVESFDENFKGLQIAESDDSDDLWIVGYPKTKFFIPVMSAHSHVAIQRKEQKLKIALEAKNKLNFMFWFSLLICCLFPFCILFVIYDYSRAGKLISQALESAMNRIEGKLADF